MDKAGQVDWKRFEKFLLKIGCQFAGQEGSHRKYKKPGLLRPIIVPCVDDLPPFVIANNLLGEQDVGILHLVIEIAQRLVEGDREQVLGDVLGDLFRRNGIALLLNEPGLPLAEEFGPHLRKPTDELSEGGEVVGLDGSFTHILQVVAPSCAPLYEQNHDDKRQIKWPNG
jgi:predicted RNA binding protein YcfA (HicA-like mRNA interferase family)